MSAGTTRSALNRPGRTRDEGERGVGEEERNLRGRVGERGEEGGEGVEGEEEEEGGGRRRKKRRRKRTNRERRELRTEDLGGMTSLERRRMEDGSPASEGSRRRTTRVHIERKGRMWR